MKSYGRVFVVHLAAALALLGPSALAQNLFEADFNGGTIDEFVNTNGVLSTNPTPFYFGVVGASRTGLRQRG